jgi:diguanylate cyclase (GGDEF)-like protein
MGMPMQRGDREWDETALLDEIGALLADPAHAGNPLRPVLQRLRDLHCQQCERLERLVRISDGYHGLAREDSNTLADRFEREMYRLRKLARISDLYQRGLLDLTEALRDASLKDPLTGLGNRRYLMDRLQEESTRALRTQMPLCIAILDVDHFKLVNDNHGHDIGDRTLCSIAAVFDDTLRDYDIVGRWGGEEFLILLPDTTLDSGFRIVERIRARIAELRIEDDQHPEAGPVTLTASVGLSVYGENESISAAVARADDALLSAKRAGRDCCRSA